MGLLSFAANFETVSIVAGLIELPDNSDELSFARIGVGATALGLFCSPPNRFDRISEATATDTTEMTFRRV